ncbi:MAG: hypothetical protein PHE67_04130 [Campylobacterales bacterium]|nr:hypothetical protein [Campylobacterales bacterium]
MKKIVTTFCVLLFVSGCAYKQEVIKNPEPAIIEDITTAEANSVIITDYLKAKGLYDYNSSSGDTEPIVLKTPATALEHITTHKSLDNTILNMDLYSLLHFMDVLLSETNIDKEEYKFKIYSAVSMELDKYNSLDKRYFLEDFKNIDMEKIKEMKKEVENVLDGAKYEN